MNWQPVKYKWITSFAVVCFLLLVANILLFPLFNSGDDVFMLYRLSGGFGDKPTNLLHYDHVWHPFLGGVLAFLFRNFPGLNWYTLLLVLLQITACSTILCVFLRRFPPLKAIGIFLLLFCCIESRALLSLNFTYTAWITAAAGLCLLLEESGKAGRTRWSNIAFAVTLLLLADLLRLQVLLAINVLFLPVFLIRARPKIRVWVPVMLGLWIVVFLLNFQQKQHYKAHIPGWAKEEKFRQSLFYGFNRTINLEKPMNEIFRDSTEAVIYWSQFFYDTGYISQGRIETIVKDLTRFRNFKEKDDWQALHWLIIEWRVYLLLFAICFFILWQQGILFTVFRRWWLPALVIMGFYAYLFLFLKITEPVHLGTILLFGIFLALSMPTDRSASFATIRWHRYLPLLFLIPLSWMMVRLVKKDRENRERHRQFECVTHELRQHSDKLFVATDDGLPLEYFYIWDCPAKNSIPNVVYKDRMLTRTYGATLERFGINDLLPAIVQNQSVFLLGRDFPALVTYYRERYQLRVNLSPRLPGYNCIEVRKASVPPPAE